MASLRAYLTELSNGLFAFAVVLSFTSGAVGSLKVDSLEQWQHLQECVSITDEGEFRADAGHDARGVLETVSKLAWIMHEGEDRRRGVE